RNIAFSERENAWLDLRTTSAPLLLRAQAMRIIGVFIVLGACTQDGEVDITPGVGPSLGVGLVQEFQVKEKQCTGGYDEDCVDVTPSSIDVTIDDGSTVKVAGTGASSFELLGVGEGPSWVTVTTGDGNYAVVTVDVAKVGSTQLFAPRKVSN